ncbi:hypothetical protein QOT17_020612 [Balamuthia mandrillaris]
MGCCCSKRKAGPMTKTARAVAIARRNLRPPPPRPPPKKKTKKDGTEVEPPPPPRSKAESMNLLLDVALEDDEVTELFGYLNDDYAEGVSVVQVRPDDFWKAAVVEASALRDHKVELICHSLLRNTCVEELHLEFNMITAEGAVHLAELIRHNTRLHSLRLANNLLGNEGCLLLLKALKENKSLKSLDLKNNRIDGKDVSLAIVKKLQKNSTLVELQLEENRITQDALLQIKEILSKNHNRTRTYY